MKERIGTVKVNAALKLRAAIQEGARANCLVRLSYTKRNGKHVRRFVLPYSYRGHLFYGKDQHTKSFIISRIDKATVTSREETPDYPVEI